MTETEAIRALQAGDPDGLTFLVTAYEHKAMRVAFAITGDRLQAEDIVAEAFLAVHRQIKRFDSVRPFGPWFIRIVVNGALAAARKGRTARKVVALLARNRPPADDPMILVERNELRRTLIRGIRALPPQERAAISLRYVLDLDEKATADILGWPVGTLKTRLHRARSRLRNHIGPELSEYIGQMAPEEA
jgi:RNA polymerase sigma-70 factor (ECF subfamily)